MKNGKYTAEDIDEKVLRYVDAYIKQTLKYTKADYIKELSNERKYTDLLKKRNDGLLTLVGAESDRYIYEKIQIDDYIIEFESETVFREIMRLTEKQRGLAKECGTRNTYGRNSPPNGYTGKQSLQA